ncbi:copper chaperone PCu(A)C [Streptomyces sp. NPDC020096]
MKTTASALRAVLIPVTACAVGLGGLTAWTTSGAAGRPAHLGVTDARVLLPSGDGEATAAIFQLRNDGDADDDLVRVTSEDTGQVMLARTVVRDGGGRMSMQRAATVPAHGWLQMTPFGLDAMVDNPPRLRVGDLVPFTLYFRDRAPVRIAAVVVSPEQVRP